MSSKWYYVRNNQAHGPLSREAMIDSIKAGEIQLFDLVFKEGGTQWRTVAECEELRSSSIELTSDSTNNENKQWVVLKATVPGATGASQFRQQGPFSSPEIMALVHRGEVAFSDYVWKPGYKKWTRIGEVNDFDRRDQKSATLDFPAVPEQQEFAREEMLASVVKLKAVSTAELLRDPDPIPVEAKEASTGGTVTIEGRTNSPTYARENVSEDKPQLKVIKGGKAEQDPPKNAFGLVARAGFAASIAILISAGLYYFMGEGEGVRERELALQAKRMVMPAPESGSAPQSVTVSASTSAPASAPETVVAPTSTAVRTPAATPRSEVAARVASVATSTPAQEMRPQTEPSLEIMPLNLTGPHPQLVFQTNVPVGQTIEVWLVGKTGQILQLLSYQTAVKIQRQNGEVPTLNLEDLHMPRGQYEVEARMGDKVAKADVFIGKNDEDFHQKLDRHRKQIAPQQQQERTQITSLTKSFQENWTALLAAYGQARKSPVAWKKFYSKWHKEFKTLTGKGMKISISSRNQYAYPDLWLELKSLHESINNQAGNLNSAVMQKRAVANAVDPTISKRLKKMKVKTAHLNSRRKEN